MALNSRDNELALTAIKGFALVAAALLGALVPLLVFSLLQ